MCRTVEPKRSDRFSIRPPRLGGDVAPILFACVALVASFVAPRTTIFGHVLCLWCARVDQAPERIAWILFSVGTMRKFFVKAT